MFVSTAADDVSNVLSASPVSSAKFDELCGTAVNYGQYINEWHVQNMKLIMCKLLLHFVSKFSNINKPLTTFHIMLNEIKMPEFTSYKIFVFRLQYIARITVD